MRMFVSSANIAAVADRVSKVNLNMTPGSYFGASEDSRAKRSVNMNTHETGVFLVLAG